MKKIFYMLTLLPIVALGSCDTREDVFYNEKHNPVLNFSSTSGENIFQYVKMKNLPYQVGISIGDIGNVDFMVQNGNGFFDITQGVNNVFSQNLNLAPGNYTITFATDSVGESDFTLVCTDKYGKIDSLNLTLNVFFNWIPTAVFSVDLQSGGYPHEYTFSSNTSVDQDAAYGGGIIRYIYTIDGQGLNDSLNVPLKTFNYVFPQAGNYNIKHWTLDNDSALSNVFNQSISIN